MSGMPQTSGRTAGARIGVELHAVRDGADLERLWRQLPEAAVGTPFQSRATIAGFLGTVATGWHGEIKVALLRSVAGGPADLLLPLFIHRRGPVMVAEVPDRGLCDMAAPVFVPDSPAAVQFAQAWPEIVGGLGADIVRIKHVVAQVRGHANPLAGVADIEPANEGIFAFDLTGEAYARARVERSVYAEARRKRRKLAQIGDLRMHFAETPPERERIFETLIAQAGDRLARSGIDYSLNSPEIRAFYHALLCEGAATDRAWLAALELDGEILAATAALHERGQMTGVLNSITSGGMIKYSPGIVLIDCLLERAREAGIREFCFGNGTQGYKARFGAESLALHTYCRPITRFGAACLRLKDMFGGAVLHLGPSARGGHAGQAPQRPAASPASRLH